MHVSSISIINNYWNKWKYSLLAFYYWFDTNVFFFQFLLINLINETWISKNLLEIYFPEISVWLCLAPVGLITNSLDSTLFWFCVVTPGIIKLLPFSKISSWEIFCRVVVNPRLCVETEDVVNLLNMIVIVFAF